MTETNIKTEEIANRERKEAGTESRNTSAKPWQSVLSNFEESSGSSDDGFSKMTAHDGKPERIVRRGGRRGRRPATIDSKAKLERSRQSARECRARKKLRYQYLEELVTSREKSIYALRDELEMMKLWCVSIDSNKVPPEIYDFLEKEKDQTSIVYPLNPGSQSLDKSSFDKFVKRAVQEVKGKSLNKLSDRGKESMCSSLATDSSMAGPSQQKLDHRVVIAPRIKIVSGTTVLPSIDKQRDADDCKSLTSSSCDSIPEMTGFSRSRSSDIRSDLTFESLLPDSP